MIKKKSQSKEWEPILKIKIQMMIKLRENLNFIDYLK
jgi:hypothetical protein